MSDVEQIEPEIEIVENSGCDNSGPTKSRCTNLTLRILFSTPGLILLVIFYSIMGALIFQLLEAPNTIENGVSVSKSRDECLKELWTITGENKSFLNFLFFKFIQRLNPMVFKPIKNKVIYSFHKH